MYFLQKNFLNILIWAMIFGVAAVVFNILVPSHSYDYEEYYELSSELEASDVANINITLNEGVNQDYSHKAASVEQLEGSNFLLFSLSEVERESISDLRNQFQSILDNVGAEVDNTSGIVAYFNGAYLIKFIIIVSSLLLGAAVGMLFSLRSGKVRSEKDIREYLNENTLGTF